MLARRAPEKEQGREEKAAPLKAIGAAPTAGARTDLKVGHHKGYFSSSERTAVVMAWTPVRIAGSGNGANSLE